MIDKYNWVASYMADEGPLRRELYKKDIEYLNAGSWAMERLCSSGNQTGKTTKGLVEGFYHASGLYPHWWEGRRFDRPTVGVFGAITWDLIRTSLQAKLLTGADRGYLEKGTGVIPKEILDQAKFISAPAIRDTYSEIHIPHVSGDMSKILFKTYESGVDKWKSFTADWIYMDEEPDFVIYTEALIRILVNKGIISLGYTPDEEGITETTLHFFDEETGELKAGKQDNKYVAMIGWDDVPHLDPEFKKNMLKTLPPHRIKAKSQGIPTSARGSVFQLEISNQVDPDFEIPDWYKKIFIVNPGVTTLNILWAAIDPDSDQVFIYDEVKTDSISPYTAVEICKKKGHWIPGIINNVYEEVPKKESSKQLGQIYEDSGLNVYMMNENINSEAGNDLLKVAFLDNKLRLFSSCKRIKNELQMYHRKKDGRYGITPTGLIDCLKILYLHGLGLAESLSEYSSYHKKEFSYAIRDGRNKVTGY